MMRILIATLVLALGAAACSTGGPQLGHFGVSGSAVELSSVPFYPSDENQCAVSALAAMVAARQVPLKLEELTPQISAAAQEPLQNKIIAATRSHGLVPYVLHSPHLDLDVVHEVQAGNPVMVLQNRGFSFAPRWQYAVVVGVDPQSNTLTLRACTKARETRSFGEFLDAWRDADNWAMVVMPPDRLPATADAQNWLGSVAPFDALKQADVSERAYAAATEHWPDNAAAWEGLGNARHAQNDFLGTSQALLNALKLAPQNTVARNNLAYVLLERNCADQAEGVIDQAIAGESDPQKLAIYRRTRRQILAHEGPSVVCPGL